MKKEKPASGQQAPISSDMERMEAIVQQIVEEPVVKGQWKEAGLALWDRGRRDDAVVCFATNEASMASGQAVWRENCRSFLVYEHKMPEQFERYMDLVSHPDKLEAEKQRILKWAKQK